ncbi:MAG: hypothetical protein ACRDN0_15260 [Trebonia sp.]
MADMYASGGANGDPRRRRSISRRAQVATAIAGCAVIAGGAFAVTEAVSGGHSAPATATATAAASGPTGQAAVLSDALSSAASTPSTSSPTSGTAAQRAQKLHARHLLALIRGLGGQYGQFTYGTKTGPRTLAFERGSVVSISGDDVTVRAKDGTTWTWVDGSKSVVRESGKRVESTSLATGQSVFVGGVIAGTTRDAKLLVIR